MSDEQNKTELSQVESDQPELDEEEKKRLEREKKNKETFGELFAMVADIEELTLTERPKPSKAVRQLYQLFIASEKKEYLGLLQVLSEYTQKFATRVAQVYVRLFSDLSWTPSMKDLVMLAQSKRFITYCFESSGFWSTQFLSDMLRKRAEGVRKAGKPFAANAAAIRLVILDSLMHLDGDVLVDMTLEDSETAALITLGLLCDVLPLTLTGEANRRFLLEEFDPYSKLKPENYYSGLVANVWMLCSYSTAPNKHIIKKRLNEWYKRTHQVRAVKVRPVGSVVEKGNTDGKPVLAVVAERFNSGHAVHRWYSKIITGLREHFYVVLVAMECDTDENSRKLFDRCVLVTTDDLNIQPFLDQCTPDLVYYLSIGMRSWAISMSNLRWGTLQIMSHGHPATSTSDFMDGAILTEKSFSTREVCTENQLLINADCGSVIAPFEGIKLPFPWDPSGDVIKIAVPCNAMKINLSFMVALAEIASKANSKVQFTFFPNSVGLGHLSTVRRIQSFLPDAVIAKRLGYQAYLNTLNEHHFAICPFPFGNASSTIDCLILGLPALALIGLEPHSRTDYDVLSSYGLEDYCVADSKESYIQGALNWIDNPEMLAELRSLISSKGLRRHHFNPEEAKMVQEIPDALWWAWQNREELINNRHGAYGAYGNWLMDVGDVSTENESKSI